MPDLAIGDWLIVAVDARGVDAVYGPYSTREEAAGAWRKSVRARCDISAYASYRQLTPAEEGPSHA